MRIGIVCPYDLTTDGGVQQLCRELAVRLAEAGDDPRLVGPGTPETGRTVSVSANRSSVPLSLDPRAIASIRRRLADVDVVHVHEPFIPVVGWAALTLDKPTVATFHADPAPWTRRVYRSASRIGRRLLGDSVVTAASAVAAEALPVRWGEPVIIPNAIDVPSYRVPVPRRAHRVVFLGRDDPRKGLEVLLAAWSAIRRTVSDAELVVLGRGHSRTVPGVEFRGRVDEETKRATLASASVMVAPNLGGESFGITVAEAMAAGCAVVASDLPAFDAVLAGTGVLVRPGDAEELSREVALLLTDGGRRETLAERAQEAASRFDWGRVLGLYRAAYESAVIRHRTTIDARKE
ncbi:MAG TPA: glycosyltransferase family 4 protein [Acidimicrobiia bacterium]|nr:glycosyltransferase family 4 protein [Acidimicrobiia bacterium]